MALKLYAATVLTLLSSILPTSTAAEKIKKHSIDIKDISEAFQDIPDSIKTAVYWYWLSNNISKEGVIKDLHSMKKVGINRAFLGSMGINDIPYGDVAFMSPEWWEITETALETATELGIEIGIFNSPGWSQSGGPWVKPDEAMRYLASSSVNVTGNGHLQEIALPEVDETRQPVKVIAFPSINGITLEKEIVKHNGKEATIDFPIPSGAVIRSITLSAKSTFRTRVKICVREGDAFKTIKEAYYDRCNTSLNVGFDPLAPVVISIPETECREMRVILNRDGDGTVKIKLSTIPYVERYPEKTLAKMFQFPLPMWDEYMWPEQPSVSDTSLVISPSSVIDITSSVHDGTARWKVPDGKWTVLYTWMTPTGVTNSPAVPEATGLETDKMSKTHIKSHFEAYIGQILKRIPAEKRESFRIVVQDSYETGGQNWTDDMVEYFIKKYGYDPTPYIPVMYGHVVGSRDMSDRFLWDLRRAVADRVAYDYVGGLRDICHENGLNTWLECYGHWGFPGEFLMYGGQSDEIGGEFWSEGNLGDIENKAAASCGHIYGKDRIWAESCTSGGPAYYRYPRMLKQRLDRFFAEGINSTLLHLYIHQPDDRKPGMAAWFGNEFNRNNTWFDYMDLFTSYLKRCNFVLQQGQYVADAAYFIGEDAPKMTGVCDPPLPYGYSSDYINAEVLLEHSDVRNGRLVLDSGMEYDLLVLPRQKSMRPEVLSKISRLVKKGLTVTGPAPEHSPSLQDYPAADRKIGSIAGRMWGKGKNGYGKGFVYPETDSLEQIFSDLDIKPDIEVSGYDKENIRFIHRRLHDSDIYFISNQADNHIGTTISFRIPDMVPQIWDPVTGEIMEAQYKHSGNRTDVYLDMAPLGSIFVVFRKDISGNDMPPARKSTSRIHVNGPWTTEFHPHGADSTFTVVSDTLYDWSKSENSDIRHYSGTAIYRTTLSVSKEKGCTYRIELGRVMVMAKVWINGRYAGGVWTDPYSLDITQFVEDGINEIKVSVANNWMNRLIGDAALPENRRCTYLNVNPWTKDSALQESGLIGPVTVAVSRQLSPTSRSAPRSRM